MRIDDVCFDPHDLLDDWRHGNDHGRGFAAGLDDQTPQEACEHENWVHAADLDPEGSVLAYDHVHIYVIRDSHGPWAVKVADR